MRALGRGLAVSVVWVGCIAGCVQPVIRDEKPAEPVLPATGPSYESADLKKRLWILPFLETAAPSDALAKVTASELLLPRMQQIFASPKGPFILPLEEDNGLRELNVDSSTPPADVAKIARGTGVTGFIRGEITSLQLVETVSPEGLLKNKSLEVKLGVSYELYDASSARRIAQGNEMQSYNETRSDLFGTEMSIPEVEKRIAELAAQLSVKIWAKLAPYAEKMGWEGRVLRTDSTRIYINAGRRTGIQIGDTLKVVEASKEIQDPQTGSIVGQAPGRMKGTLKVIQQFGLDGCIAVLQSGGGIRAGDRVELY